MKNVIQISNGVAVLADNTWSAMQGRRALKVQWDEGAMANTSSATIHKMFADLLEKPGAVALNKGNAATTLPAAAKKIEALYEAPYLSHAPMEPHSCVVSVKPDSCEIWAGTQIPSDGARCGRNDHRSSGREDRRPHFLSGRQFRTPRASMWMKRSRSPKPPEFR